MLNIVEHIKKTGKHSEPFTRKEEPLINSSPCKTLITPFSLKVGTLKIIK
jgi:hypothetical protein